MEVILESVMMKGKSAVAVVGLELIEKEARSLSDFEE